MIQEVKYNGYSTTPSDHECLEGDLAVSMNLIPEDAAVKPIMPPSEVMSVPTGKKILTVHETSAYTHYILLDGDAKKLNWIDKDDASATVQEINHAFTGADILKVDPVGNTLVVLATDGVHYVLWDVETAAYRYLGQKPPRLDITWGLESEFVAYPGYKDNGTANNPIYIKDTWSDTSVGKIPIDSFDLHGTVTSSSDPVGVVIAPKSRVDLDTENAYLMWGGGDWSMEHLNDPAGYIATEINHISDKAIGAINKLVANEGAKKGRFIYPFYVRYAYRLFDGTHIMHSYPVLMVPNSRGPFFGLNGHWDSSGQQYLQLRIQNTDSVWIAGYHLAGRAYGFASELKYEATPSGLSDWKDIIQGVDIYVSAPAYTINQDGKVYGWKNMDDTGAWNSYYTIGKMKDEVSGAYGKNKMADIFPTRTVKTVNNNLEKLFEKWDGGPNDYNAVAPTMPSYILTVPEPDAEEMDERLVNAALFYKVHSFDFDEINVGSMSGTLPIKDGVLDSLVARERLEDDYYSRDTLTAGQSYAYNGRINLSGIKRMPHIPLDAHTAWTKYDVLPSKHYNIAVEIPNEERVNVLASGLGQNNIEFPLFVFYPDPAARVALIESDGGRVRLKLKEHPLLWGAYWHRRLWDEYDATAYPAELIESDTTTSAQPVVERSKVYTSAVDNPFYFPATGVNTVGTGEIIGICSAVKAMSQGQFGQFPLYAFTTEGVWALQTTSEGGYSAVQPVTRDVCKNAESITQMDDAVLFTTDRGIMVISGSNVQCISEAIDGEGIIAPDDIHSSVGKMAAMLGLDIDIKPFKEFLPGCRMIYDYEHQRVIVYHPTENYAYIYSLESNKWGMMESGIDYGINSYPDAMAVTRGGKLVNYSEPVTDDSVNALLITRPLTLGQADVMKTIDTVLQRGMFPRRLDKVASVLYGSRDLYHWHLVSTSNDENMRGYRGTPYKWFRIGLMLRLKSGESITSASVQFQPRLTNTLR